MTRRPTLALLLVVVACAPSAVARAQAPQAADGGVPTPDAATPTTVSPDAGAQLAPPTRESSSWDAFPLLSYSRETQVALGGFGVTYFRIGDAPPESRPSYLAGDVVVTTRAQVLVDVFPVLWWDDEHWFVTGQIAYRRYPDDFYGIGNDTRPEDKETYTLHGISTRFDLRYRAWKSLFIGARHEFQWHELIELDDAPMLAAGNIRGSEGGFRNGIGPTLVWDSRDNTQSARSGLYYQASFLVYGGFLGSDYDYARLTLDAAHYLALGERHTLAFQVFIDAMAGDVPFNQLALLGGISRMRGYYEGQYRDKTYAMAQLEYRMMPIFWRIGAVVFAGIGEVAERWRDFRWDRLRWAVGAGLRFALNVEERINIRVDVGVGPGTWGLYVNVLEAF